MKLLFLFCLPLSAAVTNISVETLSAQAKITYTAPDLGRCTIALSTAVGLSPLFPQFDTSKFGASANSDAQFSYLDSGLNRTLIAGQKTAKRGTTDGISYSLALAEASQYYFQITCGASVSSVQLFTTRSAPMGLMYIDPIQADSANPGEALWPSINWATRQFYTDPQTGVQIQPLSLPHDITTFGLSCCGPTTLTNASISKSGAGWAGSNFAYTITADATSGLVFGASGLIGWPRYPLNNGAASYDAYPSGSLNWVQWVVGAESNNAGCPGLGAQCVITMCMSENKVNCDPWSPVIPCTVGSALTTCTFGTTSTANQGGWASATHRFRNAPEVVDRSSGSVTCNGTTTIVLPSSQPTNPLWTNGTPITINGTGYLMSSVANETTVVLQSTCPTGTYSSWNVSTLSWIIKAQQASSDTIAIFSATSQWELGSSPSWPDAGFYNWNSLSQSNAASSYLFNLQPGHGLYAFNSTSGATSLIGVSLATPSTLCSPGASTWDTRNNQPIQYCIIAGSQLYSVAYSPTTWADAGNFDSGNTVACGTAPCWTHTNMTAGTSLDALALAFDPTYLGASKGISCSNGPSPLVGMNQLGQLIISCNAGSSTRTYIMAFDPLATTNSKPGNVGCIGAILGNSNPGCIVAQVAAFLVGPSKGNATKADIRHNAGPGIVMWQPQPNSGSADGAGPWQVIMSGSLSATPTACPPNPYVTGSNCSTITVSGEPYDPTPGPNETGLPGEYITAAAGDYLTFSNSGASTPGDGEVIRIVIKNSSTSWVIQRGISRDFAFCSPPVAAYTCGYGTAPAATGASPVIFYGVSSGEMMWDCIHDPTGANVQAYNYDGESHRFTLNGYDFDTGTISGATGANWPACAFSSYANGGCYGSRLASSTTGLLSPLPSRSIFTGSTPLFPQFNNTASVASGNSTQTHPSPPGLNGSADSMRYGSDARPFNGLYTVGSQPCNATNVSGSLWKVAVGCNATGLAGGLHRKIFPTKAHWGIHPLLDASPAVLGTTPDFKYCVATRSNECQSGSVAGEIYFNVPYLAYPYCLFGGQATATADTNDICIMDNNPVLDTGMQMPLDAPFDAATRQRIVSHFFTPPKVNAPFGNMQSLPNNQWWVTGTHFFGSVRNEVIVMKRSVEQVDSIDRTNYQMPAISVPAAPGYAQLRWGYLEYGSDGVGIMQCTSRTENCRSVASPTLSNPFNFGGSETQIPTPCSSGCIITPAFIGDRMVLYQVLRTDAAGTVSAIGSTQAMAVR